MLCAIFKPQHMKIIFALIVLTFLYSCSKKNATSNNLIGTWIFTNETSTTSYNWSPTSDSLYITFDNSNHYVYRQYSFPIDNGTYSIIQDSIITFKPDSSYSPFFHLLHNIFVNSGPDTGWHYVGEKIYFKKNANQLKLTSTWISLLGSPPGTVPSINNFFFTPKQ